MNAPGFQIYEDEDREFDEFSEDGTPRDEQEVDDEADG